MKRILFLFVCNIIMNCHNTVTAQSLSIEETKTILCGHKWLLKTLEQDNKAVAVPEKLRGLKMVFNTDGYAYRFMPSDVEAEKAKTGLRWSITKTQLSIADKLVYSYRLKDMDGMKLYLTLPGQSTFVYERDRNITTDESDWYDLISTPELDSSMKKLAARINQDMAYYKIIVGSWDLEKVSFKEIVTKPGDSNDAYTAVFKKALLDTKKELNALTEEEKDQIDLEASIISLFYFGSGFDFKEDNKLSLRWLLGAGLASYAISYGSLNVKGDDKIESDFEIVKLTSKELVLKDKKLMVTYYYKRSKK